MGDLRDAPGHHVRPCLRWATPTPHALAEQVLVAFVACPRPGDYMLLAGPDDDLVVEVVSVEWDSGEAQPMLAVRMVP